MRSQPRSTRLAVATLYGRLRRARREFARARADGHQTRIDARSGELIALENALSAVRDTIHTDADRPAMPAGPFLGLVRLAAQGRRAAAARAAVIAA